jgi:hypothetical protein
MRAPTLSGRTCRFDDSRSRKAFSDDKGEKNGRESMLRRASSAMILNLSRPRAGSTTAVTIQKLLTPSAGRAFKVSP